MDQRDAEDWADAIRTLAPWAARIRAPGFSFGTWHEMERRADGVSTMPWFDFSADGMALLAAAGPFLLPGFDWPAWTQTDEALRLRDDPDAIAQPRHSRSRSCSPPSSARTDSSRARSRRRSHRACWVVYWIESRSLPKRLDAVPDDSGRAHLSRVAREPWLNDGPATGRRPSRRHRCPSQDR